MGYYAYVPTVDGLEPVGTANRAIRHDLYTDQSARKWAKRLEFANKPYKLFYFRNIYDDSTFREIRTTE